MFYDCSQLKSVLHNFRVCVCFNEFTKKKRKKRKQGKKGNIELNRISLYMNSFNGQLNSHKSIEIIIIIKRVKVRNVNYSQS